MADRPVPERRRGRAVVEVGVSPADGVAAPGASERSSVVSLN
jgi:hypothetical protein